MRYANNLLRETMPAIRTGWCLIVLGIILCISLIHSPAMSTEGIDPEAESILKSMSSYLGATKEFSVNADIDFEVVDRNGQKLQLSSYATLSVNRPAKLHIQRKGMIADAEFIFDGKMLTMYGKNLNVYSQIEVPGTIDDAIRAYELETGIPAPGADLLFADPHAILSSGVTSGVYIGTAYVNGIESHHLAFREDKVDWQLWVKTGNEPLPMKYIITSKWHTGAPQYEIRLRDWDTKPIIRHDQFTFSEPKGAKKLKTLPVDETGEVTSAEEGK